MKTKLKILKYNSYVIALSKGTNFPRKVEFLQKNPG